jgi:hypothetical protein
MASSPPASTSRRLRAASAAHAAQEARGDARRAARAAGDLHGTVFGQRHAEDSGAAADDALELVRLVEDQAERDAEALAQRSGDETGARRRADQGEGR